LNCPSCGREVAQEDALFCLYCGSPLGRVRKRSGFPIAGGVLTIIAGCLAIIYGILGTLSFIISFGQRFPGSVPLVGYLIMGILGLLAFALGLTSGIFALKRRRFALSIAGTCIGLLSGVSTIVIISLQGPYAVLAGLLFGLPVVILAILAVIFTAMARKEFE
jgi:hypothetical protein